MVERRREREPRRRGAVDLVVRLEGRREHPEDGEDHHREDREAEDVPAPPPHRAPPAPPTRADRSLESGHVTSPIRTIRRT